MELGVGKAVKCNSNHEHDCIYLFCNYLVLIVFAISECQGSIFVLQKCAASIDTIFFSRELFKYLRLNKDYYSMIAISSENIELNSLFIIS